jgi:hypothetical protein
VLVTRLVDGVRPAVALRDEPWYCCATFGRHIAVDVCKRGSKRPLSSVVRWQCQSDTVVPRACCTPSCAATARPPCCPDTTHSLDALHPSCSNDGLPSIAGLESYPQARLQNTESTQYCCNYMQHLSCARRHTCNQRRQHRSTHRPVCKMAPMPAAHAASHTAQQRCCALQHGLGHKPATPCYSDAQQASCCPGRTLWVAVVANG